MELINKFIESYYIDIISLTIIAIVFVILVQPKIAHSHFWRATATPFASIIGSGFLIIAPLLWLLAGPSGIWLMVITLILAYCMGGILRYNIRYSEPVNALGGRKQKTSVMRLHTISDFVLSLAYFISVVFYLKVLGSFALRAFNIENVMIGNIITTLVLLASGIYGKIKGFDLLESLEVYSVSIKLCIIIGYIMALLLYDIETTHFYYHNAAKFHFSLDTLEKLGGMLLVVQGFETSRYLGHKYHPEMRVNTMRFAQIISSLIYLFFVYLSAFLMTGEEHIQETEIITITAKISTLLPFVIIIGAIASQYSSSIADMIGCGSIINDLSNKKISLESSYLVIALIGLFLIWAADIFEIIAYASRAFALYYFLQCIIALYVSEFIRGPKRHIFHVFAIIVGLIMFLIFLFGKPV